MDFGVDAEILEGLDLEDMDLYKVEADAPLTEDEKAAVWDELACLIATAEKLRENIKGTQLMHSLFQFGSGVINKESLHYSHLQELLEFTLQVFKSAVYFRFA